MSRLRRYKAQGPPGDRYEHYKHIPDDMMRAMIDRCLNDRLPDGFREVYADGLIHAGDKGKLDKKGRQAARPIVVGCLVCYFITCRGLASCENVTPWSTLGVSTSFRTVSLTSC